MQYHAISFLLLLLPRLEPPLPPPTIASSPQPALQTGTLHSRHESRSGRICPCLLYLTLPRVSFQARTTTQSRRAKAVLRWEPTALGPFQETRKRYRINKIKNKKKSYYALLLIIFSFTFFNTEGRSPFFLCFLFFPTSLEI